MLGKLQGIQALRGIAVLLVIFAHLFQVEEKYAGEIILPKTMLLGVSGIDIFFVISGFIMVVTTHKKREGILNSINFLYRRAIRIYPTYWIYTTLVLIVYLLNHNLVNSGAPVDILASYALWPTDNPFLVAVGWTLSFEIYFYLVFTLMFTLPERFFSAALAAWAALVIIAGTLYQGDTPWIRIILSPLTIEFIAGALLAQMILIYRPTLPLAYSGFLIIASLGLIFIAGRHYLNSTGDIPTGWARVLFLGLPATLIVFCTYSAENKGARIPLWMTKIGDASYSTYLSHILVLSALGHTWAKLSHLGIIENYFVLPTMVAASLIYGWVSYTYLEKPILNSLARRRVGPSTRLTRPIDDRINSSNPR